MTKHGRPSSGYLTDIKEKYRRKFWDAAESMVRKPRSRLKVAVLDTRDGGETRHLLKRGFAAKNIHAVNSNPAEVAALTFGLRRDGLPDVNTHGVGLLQALDDIGKVDVVNFDGCAPIGWGVKGVDGVVPELHSEMDMAKTWGTLLGTIPFGLNYGGVVGHTMMVGRERRAELMFRDAIGRSVVVRGQSVPATYLNRLSLACLTIKTCWTHRCFYHITDLKFDWYTSPSGQVFIWMAAKVIPHQPLNPHGVACSIGRRFHDSDRMLVLMLPFCARLFDDEDVPFEENFLYRSGNTRYRGGPGGDFGGAPDDDDANWNPLEAFDGKTTPMRT